MGYKIEVSEGGENGYLNNVDFLQSTTNLIMKIPEMDVMSV